MGLPPVPRPVPAGSGGGGNGNGGNGGGSGGRVPPPASWPVRVRGAPTSTCFATLVCRTPDCTPRCRRDPLNVGVRGWDEYGSAWVSAQLIGFIFGRMTPPTRAALDAQRARLSGWAGAMAAAGTAAAAATAAARTAFGWGGRDGRRTIGMHVRAGDSCHRHRFCPANLTASYFAHAATLRAKVRRDASKLTPTNWPIGLLSSAAHALLTVPDPRTVRRVAHTPRDRLGRGGGALRARRPRLRVRDDASRARQV